MSHTTYALIDCNNFYVSCERVFNPALRKLPVAVLSNNDGCIIARSDEVKDLGIPMGAPYFKYKKQLEENNCVVLSSNYTLYGDMSSRVMNCLSEFSSQIEYYSIDEAFIELSHIKQEDLTEYGQEIKDYIYKATGIPVSLGIAPTKTLAKMANILAKKEFRTSKREYRASKLNSVFSLIGLNDQELAYCLEKTKIEDVWGIGRKYSKMLQANQVDDALAFTKLPESFVQAKMSVTGLKTLRELKGNSCLELDTITENKKSIISSSSFGQPIENLEDLKPAVATFCTRIGEKLRKQGSKATYLSVFITTSRFKSKEELYYQACLSVPLPEESNYTPQLITTAFSLLEKIYKEGYQFKKAGVMVSSLSQGVQENLLREESEVVNEKKEKAMKVIDKLNSKLGRYTIKQASLNTKVKWQPIANLRSPRYTTEPMEMMRVKL